MKILMRTNAILFLLSLTIEAFAADQFSCPDSIDFKGAIVSKHAGWQFGSEDQLLRRPYPLLNINFSNGPPKIGFIIHPDTIEELPEKNSILTSYIFNRDKDDVWIICSYQDTREWLVRQVVANKCTVTTNTETAGASANCS